MAVPSAFAQAAVAESTAEVAGRAARTGGIEVVRRRKRELRMRLGEPEDVADVIMLLASDRAHWVTGQLIKAGGGYNM